MEFESFEPTFRGDLSGKYNRLYGILLVELVGFFTVNFGTCADQGSFYFEKKYQETKHQAPPETRLPMAIAGAFCFPVSSSLCIQTLTHLLDLALLVRLVV